MASHSLTGQASGSGMSARDAMDQDVVEEIITDVLKTFPNEKVSNIRQAIRQKLANSAKTLRKKN